MGATPRAPSRTRPAPGPRAPSIAAGTLAPAAAAQYGGLLLRLVSVARNLVRATEASGGGAPPDDLAFLRLRTLSRELMVVPGDDFILVAIQAVDEPAA